MYISEQYRIVIFGAGQIGRKALAEFGVSRVTCFLDNDNEKWGKTIDGVPVTGIDEYKICDEEIVIIAVKSGIAEIKEQLENKGVKRYAPYLEFKERYFAPEQLLVNQYEWASSAISEAAWNERMEADTRRQYIKEASNAFKEFMPVFDHIEIETYNRCNGGCSFCPVSVKNESRPEKLMDEKLFKKIIQNLQDMDYSGRIALFSNNEPMLDKRIIEFHKYTREHLPKAKMHLFTNGTMLTVEKFIELIKYLDELVIDNYSQKLEMIPQVRKIFEYCESHSEAREKVAIVLRKQNEILTTRGGDAPNRTEMMEYPSDACLLLYRQMIVRPDGKVSLCCSDPLGRFTLGDLNIQTLEQVWYDETFTRIRKLVSGGRTNYEHCRNCDLFNIS